jgi:hypothetical protein
MAIKRSSPSIGDRREIALLARFSAYEPAAAEQALAADRLRRARSLLFWRILMRRASAAAEAQDVGRPHLACYFLDTSSTIVSSMIERWL